ncbi:MAG TPA: LysM peptidoglycan-binding domain-containing protein [Anaerolineales bacterium]|nr:LysM peptidoglycan-binding domain-containing protein [Anaerolineales bacterium]
MSCNWSTSRVWFLVTMLVASLAGAPALAQGAAVVRVDPSTSSVQVNNTANIAIKVDNIANLIAFEIHLSFNPAVLEVTNLTNGGFIAADFEAQKTYDNTAGTIDYAVAQINRPPAQGSGTLLNIAFRAKANGSSMVTTRATPAAPNGLVLSDANGMAIQASWLPGTINVGSSTITSTPITPAPATNTPTKTSTPAPITNIPTNTLIRTSTITPCDDDDQCPPTTNSPTFTNTPPYTLTSTSITNTPTYTFTPTPTLTPTSTSTPNPRTHVVRWGEWLYCIGRAYRVSPWAIAEENGIWWPYIIFPGQRLTIPSVPWPNMTPGRVCKAQFTMPVPTSNPTPIPVTPIVTTTPPPAVTPIPATTAPPSTCRATYVVRSGDTLYSIAKKYGTTYTEIARVNGISNPRLIYPGQRLCIP